MSDYISVVPESKRIGFSCSGPRTPEVKIDGKIYGEKEAAKLKSAMREAGISDKRIDEMLIDGKLVKKEIQLILSGSFRYGIAPWAEGKSYFLSEVEAAGIKLPEIEVEKLMQEYGGSGSPAERIIVGELNKHIESGKLSDYALLWLALERVGHHQEIAKAAAKVIMERIPQCDASVLEDLAAICLLEYYTYNAPAEKFLLKIIETGKLSKETLLEIAKDPSDHKSPAREAAMKQLGY